MGKRKNWQELDIPEPRTRKERSDILTERAIRSFDCYSDDIPFGMTEEQYLDQLTKEYTDQLCVQIEYSLGFIYISAPPNNDDDFYVHCGNPAWGAGETIAKDENIYVGEVLYQANGYEFIGDMPSTGETLDLHNEIFWVYLEDGTRIAYGATPRTDATYEDYLIKTKEMLLRILATYEILPWYQ